MTISRHAAARVSLLAAPMLLGLAVLLQNLSLPSSRAGQPAPAINADRAVVADYADQISTLVKNGRIDELSRLSIPAGADTTKLKSWTSVYLSQVQLQEKQRDKQYSDAVAKVSDELKAGHYDKAIARTVLAFRIAKDPEAFLKLDWVKDITAKFAARAAELEKQGKWLESLTLYSDLNTLYETDTRYKTDMQRLTRRTRLLAVYCPKALLDMRKALAEQEAEPGATKPATQPDEAAELASFTRWQDYSDGVTLEMMQKAIRSAQQDWVEGASYQQLVNGGVNSLRLFLTTPELAQVFPALADKNANAAFDKALDDASAAVAGKANVTITTVTGIVTDLIDASAGSVKLPKNVLIMEFTDGAMDKLDPFSSVIWPHEVAEFAKNMNGKFGGVGIQISIDNGQLKVVSPLEDTPAYKAGIQAGDLITAIDGKSTVGITSDQAVSSISGKPDTNVTLRIRRGADPEKDVALRRAIISVTSVKGFQRDSKDHTQWDFMLDRDSKIGYVRVTGFQDNTPVELKRALNALTTQGMRGLVLDLRFNPGGLLDKAVSLCDMFLQEGLIVSTDGRNPAEHQEWKAEIPTDISPNMPMIVLVNEYSASASEIFAGAMKDHHRATIIGHRTFGKGSVQKVRDIGHIHLPDEAPEAMMKLTMAYYYLPNKETPHRRDGEKTWGVEPNIIVDFTPDQLNDLLRQRRDLDIIRPANAPASATAPATGTGPATTAEAPAPDTQLETAMLMMRLHLVDPAKVAW
jgi:carboxyl-terminal processing protease